MAQVVRSHDEHGVRTLLLDSGDGRNAVGPELNRQLDEAFAAAAADERVRVVVLTGEGRMFSAGGNLNLLLEGLDRFDPEEMRRSLLASLEIVGRIVTFPKPTLALLNGPAAGGGMAFALACDLRIAAQRAKLVYAYGAIGLAGDFGMNWLLGRLLGPGRARSFAFGGAVGADRALALGLVDEVVADEALRETGMARARELAKMSGPALAAIKRNLDCSRLSFAEAGAIEAESFIALRAGPEHRAAVEAMAAQLGIKGRPKG
jgi:enoyl-CoA hydratase/carnithine racemase